PGVANTATLNHLIVVLPDGTLVDFFSEYKFSSGGSRKDVLLSLIRSRDHGETWSPPLRVATLTTFNVTDPDSGHVVANNSTFPAIAWATVDPHNGNLYAVWEDPRFSNGQYSSIAFA